MADDDKEIERIYVIPLKKAKRGKSSRAAPKAIKIIREFLARHMKAKYDEIWIDDSLNKEIWSRGRYKIPSKIRVRAVKFEDGVVEVSLPELGFKTSRRELLKEEREKKAPILKREEGEEEEEEGIPGAEDYEIAPTADGEVKIKKKKKQKKKEEKVDIEETKKKENLKKKLEKLSNLKRKRLHPLRRQNLRNPKPMQKNHLPKKIKQRRKSE